MPPPRASQWPRLLEQALAIIDQANERGTGPDDWTFGGGTALMLQIDHRDSHDIDLFLTDPQLLPFLNPETQDFRLACQPDAVDTDGARSLKLIYEGLGEIDFICCPSLTPAPCEVVELLERPVRRETVEEIIARKIVFRGHALQPRDMFDIAASALVLGEQHVLEVLAAFPEATARAFESVRRMDAELARSVMGQLAARPRFRHLHREARAACLALLGRALA